MRRFIHIIFLLLPALSYGQNLNYLFELQSIDKKVMGSLYNSFEYIDLRYDTNFMGIVQLGGFNRKVEVEPKTPLSSQFTTYLDQLTDSTAEQRRLVIVLRQLQFAEATGGFSEKGFCYLRISAYGEEGDGFRLVNHLDTVGRFSGMDVTKGIFARANVLLHIFLTNTLRKMPGGDVVFTIDELYELDQIEKQKLKLYTATEYKEGVYLNYSSFKNQEPDKEVHAEMIQNKLSSFYTLNAKGKKETLSSKDAYAVVYDGTAYIGTGHGFYILRKTSDQLQFKGFVGSEVSSGEVAMATAFFGLLGGIIAASATSADYKTMVLDHQTGSFIPVNDIVEKKKRKRN